MRVKYQELIEKAIGARKNAHAPYSKFQVGAAVLTDCGVFPGCNVENAAYGDTCCAERGAIYAAIASGAKQFNAIAVCADISGGMPPCGSCRQVLVEFNSEMEVIISDLRKKFRVVSVRELLPEMFSSDVLRNYGKS